MKVVAAGRCDVAGKNVGLGALGSLGPLGPLGPLGSRLTDLVVIGKLKA